jgi:single-strand DNA-binding protein
MSFITVTGRLGSNAEIRKTQDGTAVASFSIADDVGFGDKKSTQWIKCALFGKRAEALAQYLTKGSVVEVMGNPSINSYEGKTGHKSELQVRVIEVRLHGGGKSERQEAPADDFEQDSVPF